MFLPQPALLDDNIFATTWALHVSLSVRLFYCRADVQKFNAGTLGNLVCLWIVVDIFK